MKAVPYESEFTRPDLPIPLPRLTGTAEVYRRDVVRLREPAFSAAHRTTARWGLVTVAVALASFLIQPDYRWPAVVVALLAALWLLVRTLSLMVFERRQRAFEREWLDAQSEVLRGHAFEVLRCSVHPRNQPGERRPYDLLRPDDVRELMRRQKAERTSRTTLEFTYWQGEGEDLAVQAVSVDLGELILLTGKAGTGRVWIRFPEARYQPATGGHRPARRTYWDLSGPVVVGVVGADTSARTSSAGAARPSR